MDEYYKDSISSLKSELYDLNIELDSMKKDYDKLQVHINELQNKIKNLEAKNDPKNLEDLVIVEKATKILESINWEINDWKVVEELLRRCRYAFRLTGNKPTDDVNEANDETNFNTKFWKFIHNVDWPNFASWYGVNGPKAAYEHLDKHYNYTKKDFEKFEKRVRDLYKKLDQRIRNFAEIYSIFGTYISDDKYSDFIYEVIARGEKEFNSIYDDPSMAAKYFSPDSTFSVHESFIYVFQEAKKDNME